MELNQIEVAIISKTLTDAEESRVLELTDLQLAFVGGGIADVIAG